MSTLALRRIFPVLLFLFTVQARAAVMMSDDFSGGFDSSKWRIDMVGFESGLSTAVPLVTNGVLQIQGTGLTTGAAYWGGSGLATSNSFTASEQTNLVFSVDRVRAAGTGSAFRSALWIFTDSTRSNYIVFSENVGEGGWQYNRKTSSGSDNPTGTGIPIPAFNVPPFNDHQLHNAKLIANGKTVRFLLDDVEGIEIPFPFSSGIFFELGGYTRDATDTVDTAFDNVSVSAVEYSWFSPTFLTVATNEALATVQVGVPPGLVASSAVQVTIRSQDPAIAIPEGADEGGKKIVAFAAGGPAVQNIRVKTVNPGVTQFTLETDPATPVGKPLIVGVAAIADDFEAGAIDSAIWSLDPRSFEVGNGTFAANVVSGQVEFTGALSTEYWGGLALQTQRSFSAAPDNLLVIEVNRVSQSAATTNRGALWICDADRSNYIFFSDNVGEGGWQYNRKINSAGDNPTGAGAVIGAFASKEDQGNHRMKMIADGSTVRLFLDEVEGPSIPFPLSDGIFVEFGGYARAKTDAVSAKFDRVRIANWTRPAEGAPFTIRISTGPNLESVSVSWEGSRGFNYQVEYSDNLTDWIAADGAFFSPSVSQSEITWTDAGPPVTPDLPANSPRRFYRVRRN